MNDHRERANPGPSPRDVGLISTSPRLFRRLLWAELDDVDPCRYRWLQEHPDTTAIVNELVDIAIGFAHHQIDHHDDGTGHLHLLDDDELHLVNAMIAADVIDIIDLWEDIHDQWPRHPPTALDPQPDNNNDNDPDGDDVDDVEEWVVELFCDYLDHTRTQSATTASSGVDPDRPKIDFADNDTTKQDQ